MVGAVGPLTDGQMRHFHTFGYVHLQSVLSPADIDTLTQRADELIATSTPEERALEAEGTQPYFLEPVMGREAPPLLPVQPRPRGLPSRHPSLPMSKRKLPSRAIA